ncbi:TPA: hypothetical protein UMF67_001807 [Stenotrophomonas maltophilia]|uniref:Uncharacterized protein n=1 Tax=Stenotrophomonas maltophilia TaxID=40324 RepID=A0AAI9FTH8_STEMA|nr:hypothetical protein [Stenotrophomonas maltophilia]HEL3158088.1 hypothetical protein [Stenotrophomonas maltophilia]
MDAKTNAAGYTALACYVSAMALSAIDAEWVKYVGAGLAATGAIALGVWLFRGVDYLDDEDDL